MILFTFASIYITLILLPIAYSTEKNFYFIKHLYQVSLKNYFIGNARHNYTAYA
jgi:hypothetical protein